ncbi:hypothetical protein FAVG1_13120 [Fusarium avenaceum]|nr:hypothetical protein FAVG1_13120 [Fusarium avenaceum]
MPSKSRDDWLLTCRQVQRFRSDLETSGSAILNGKVMLENTLERIDKSPALRDSIVRLAPLPGPDEAEVRWPPAWAETRGSFTSSWQHLVKWVEEQAVPPAPGRLVAVREVSGVSPSTQDEIVPAEKPMVKSKGYLFTPPPLNARQRQSIFGEGQPATFTFSSNTAAPDNTNTHEKNKDTAATKAAPVIEGIVQQQVMLFENSGDSEVGLTEEELTNANTLSKSSSSICVQSPTTTSVIQDDTPINDQTSPVHDETPSQPSPVLQAIKDLWRCSTAICSWLKGCWPRSLHPLYILTLCAILSAVATLASRFLDLISSPISNLCLVFAGGLLPTFLLPGPVTPVVGAAAVGLSAVVEWWTHRRASSSPEKQAQQYQYPPLEMVWPIPREEAVVIPVYLGTMKADLDLDRRLDDEFDRAIQEANAYRGLSEHVMRGIQASIKSQYSILTSLQANIDTAIAVTESRAQGKDKDKGKQVSSWWDTIWPTDAALGRAKAHRRQMLDLVQSMIQARNEHLQSIARERQKVSQRTRSGAICNVMTNLDKLQGPESASQAMGDMTAGASVMCKSSLRSQARWNQIERAIQDNLKDLAYAQSRLLHKHEDDAKEFEMALAREGRDLIEELHKLAKFGYGRDRET